MYWSCIAFSRNIAYEVLDAKPEIPEIFKWAPSGPIKKWELKWTGIVTLSGCSYISIYPQGKGFFISFKPSASLMSSSLARLTKEPSNTGV